MATKCIVIGNNPEKKKEKTIKLTHLLSSSLKVEPTTISNIGDWSYAELVCRNYTDGVDLIFAYRDPKDRSTGTLFLGQWNDGIV